MNGDALAEGGDGDTPVHPDDLAGLRHRWVTTQGQLDELEYRNVVEGRASVLARKHPVVSVLDDHFVRQLHRRCFGQVWTWAGTYRKSDTSIGIPWNQVSTAVRGLFDNTTVWLTNATDESVVRRALAQLHHQLVVIHPFVNGNRRTARLVVDILARSLDFPAPTWGQGSVEPRAAYIKALRSADRGEIASLERFMWK